MAGPAEHSHGDHVHGDHPHADHSHAGHVEPDDVPAGEWVDLLRAHGLRVTPARLAILSALRTQGHASPEEVHRTVNSAAITLSTVYRTLDSLAQQGLVAHTHLAGHLASYSLASSATHAHLVCRDCGQVSELDDAATAALTGAAQRVQGFTVDVAHLSIFGQCAECAAHAPTPSP